MQKMMHHNEIEIENLIPTSLMSCIVTNVETKFVGCFTSKIELIMKSKVKYNKYNRSKQMVSGQSL